MAWFCSSSLSFSPFVPGRVVAWLLLLLVTLSSEPGGCLFWHFSAESPHLVAMGGVDHSRICAIRLADPFQGSARCACRICRPQKIFAERRVVMIFIAAVWRTGFIQSDGHTLVVRCAENHW
mmetsp:Transcript_7515/g.13636  ORF Transcript_7515/g.13636 Transcript_7515/m.13636 type:complete len:122 (+) Transcript_7515:125-490(+)